MNASYKNRREIILLTEALLEGALDEASAASLDQLVSGDPETARLYVKYVELHGELHRMYEEQMHEEKTPSAPSTPLVNDILDSMPTDSLSSSEDQKPSSGMGLSGFVLGWFGVVAITLVISVL